MLEPKTREQAGPGVTKMESLFNNAFDKLELRTNIISSVQNTSATLAKRNDLRRRSFTQSGEPEYRYQKARVHAAC